MLSTVKNDNKILYLNLNTWESDSNYIFDYTSNEIKSIKAFISEATYVVKTNNDVFQNIEQHADIQTKNGDVLLFHVNNGSNNTYILINPIPNNLKYKEINFEYLNNKIWYVLKTVDLENKEKNSNCNEEYYLNENDIIKIGRVKYTVRKIHLLQKDNNLKGLAPPIPAIDIKYKISDLNKGLGPVFNFIVEDFIGYNDINEKKINSNEIKEKCKYCIEYNINEETDDGNNFLISVCKCKKKVHVKCLKNYFKNNLQEKNDDNDNIITYDNVMTFNDFECPDCHAPYPTRFKLKDNDKIFNLIDINEPNDCNYMILESIDYKQDEKYCKSIHIIKLIKKNGEPFKIGRDNDNDIIDRDISMSRHHAILRFNEVDGTIIIQNWESKYGTLILVRKPIKILDKKIYLQVGKTYIEASLMDKKEFEKIQSEKKNDKSEKSEKSDENPNKISEKNED